MTVSYQYDVASSASGGFIRLLFRWRGSVWKVVYREMLIFTVCYITLSLLYNFALTESQQGIFERIVYFCSTFMDLIPLSFMLGFYVSFIAARWWSQFIAIPWPDKLMNIIAMYVPGFDEDSRVLRRTLMRYLNLSLVLVLRSISMAVKRRFPTKEHLIEADFECRRLFPFVVTTGFMTKTELDMFQSVPSTEFNTFWIPCTWFINVLRGARQECRITDSNGLKLIMEELNEFRSKCGLLWGYDWISIPLVYTQVVTMATYAFYVACMFGRQNVNMITEKGSPEVHRHDYYIPIFTILQLMFYMGLLKVAEQLINPFGDDDEDFELNWIIDRHMKVSYLGVDTLNSEPPPLVKDTYYNELDVKIPYTEASKSYKKKTYRGSVAYMQVPMDQQGMVVPDMSEDEDDGETLSEDPSKMGPRRPSIYNLFHKDKAGSFTTLDNRSIGSVDSEWKSSLPNLSTAKNASGTLGFDQAAPFLVDMAKAEDDEIILQEVIIDRSAVQKPFVQRSESLQIPGSEGAKLSGLLRRSPKIAPKFPREKLKSMFRKRRLSSAFPFYKLKGVRFTKDTKDEDESLNQSLIDLRDETLDVDITLSTPELTEIEKQTGVHPYYYTQQAITSARQLATGKAVTVRQSILERSESEENKFKGQKMERFLVRSSSLPNISPSDEYASDPIIESSLKKISEVMKNKAKMRKAKTKKKSPPPKMKQQSVSSSSDVEESEVQPDTEPPPKRNILPQITVTRCEPKSSESSDLDPSTSKKSDDRKFDTTAKKTQSRRDSAEKTDKPKTKRTSQQSASKTPSSKEKTEIAPESHSTSRKPRKTSPPRTRFVTEPKEHSKKSQYRRKSPPPMRPEKLTFTKPIPAKHIAGIELKSEKEPTSPTSDSDPSSPISIIPSTSLIARTPSVPKSTQSDRESSISPIRSPTTDILAPSIQCSRAQADTTITISDSVEDLSQVADQSRPPLPPQRHVPRTGTKGKK